MQRSCIRYGYEHASGSGLDNKDDDALVPNKQTAVLTIFCAQRDHLDSLKELLTVLVQLLKQAGYHTLFGSGSALGTLGFRKLTGSSWNSSFPQGTRLKRQCVRHITTVIAAEARLNLI